MIVIALGGREEGARRGGGRTEGGARRGDEEAEERATIGKAIFALIVAILRAEGYCF